MKLTFRLVFAVIALIVVILGADAYVSVHRESAFLEQELERKAYRIGKAMKELVADAWRHQGPDAAIELIHAANEREQWMMIRWVWLDNTSDDRFIPQVPTDRLNPALRNEACTLHYRSPKGASLLLTYVSINVGQRPGALELSEPMSLIDDFVRTSILRKIALMGIVVAGTLGVTLLLGLSLVGWPLKRLTDKARRVGNGDLSGPIELRGRGELSELATTLNQMCDRLAESQQRERGEAEARIAAIEQLRHSDRLRTVGQLASGVAHELGTPLNVVTGRASLIKSGRLSPEAVVESAEIIKSQAERMTVIIRKLLDFSRSGTANRIQVDLRAIVRETSQILEPLSERHGVRLILNENSEPMSAWVDSGQIQQVLTNLIVNAIQATPSGGEVTIGVTRENQVSPPDAGAKKCDCFCLSVADTGHGIADDVRSRLFEPFVTTKEIGQGTGLGLSIAYGIIREHGGWIDVQSEVGRGSLFRAYLPERSQT